MQLERESIGTFYPKPYLPCSVSDTNSRIDFDKV